MTTLFSILRRKSESVAVSTQRTRPISLHRAFVETGDERCPIAGIWSRISTPDTSPDEPEIARAAMRRLLPWRASHLLFKEIRYSTT